jgi:YD repeat-containing protein
MNKQFDSVQYLPNGITGAYTYNPNGDINTLQYKAGSTNVLNLNYPSYDNAHNLLTQIKNGVTHSFSYDNVNQLLGVNVSGTNTESFSYDPVGNRLSSIDNSPGLTTQTMSLWAMELRA